MNVLKTWDYTCMMYMTDRSGVTSSKLIKDVRREKTATPKKSNGTSNVTKKMQQNVKMNSKIYHKHHKIKHDIRT